MCGAGSFLGSSGGGPLCPPSSQRAPRPALFVGKRGRGRPRVDGGHGGPPHYKGLPWIKGARRVVLVSVGRAAVPALQMTQGKVRPRSSSYFCCLRRAARRARAFSASIG